jgi:hypothetical protein
MMRAIYMVLAVPVFFVPAALAADHNDPEGATVQLMLLRQKSVQEELKIAPDLAKKIHDFTGMEHEEFLKAITLAKEQEEKKLKELAAANEKFLIDNLSAAQRKRLAQITMQVTGLRQLMRPEIAKALELTEEQKEKVKSMHEEAAKAYRAIIDAVGNENRNEKLAELRAATHEKVAALLTEKQKEIAKEMVGERFKGAILIEEREPPKGK